MVEPTDKWLHRPRQEHEQKQLRYAFPNWKQRDGRSWRTFCPWLDSCKLKKAQDKSTRETSCTEQRTSVKRRTSTTNGSRQPQGVMVAQRGGKGSEAAHTSGLRLLNLHADPCNKQGPQLSELWREKICPWPPRMMQG